MTQRVWATKYLPAAFLIGACFVVPGSGVAFNIATGIAAQAASEPTEQAVNWVRRRLARTDIEQINHDLQHAMVRGYTRAIRFLEEIWRTSYEPDARMAGAESSADLFAWMIEDANRLLEEDRLRSFLDSAEAIQSFGSRRQLDAFLAPYLRGQSRELERFLSSTIVSQTATFFGEELKTDTRAWRAFQRIVTDSMIAGFSRIEVTQELHQRQVLEKLSAMAEVLEREPVDHVQDFGLDGLERVIRESREDTIQAIELEGRLTRETIERQHDIQIGHLTDIKHNVERLVRHVAAEPAPESSVRVLDFGGRHRNQHFVGRDDLMRAIEDALKQGVSSEPNLVVLHGTGGVGKSQTALEFAFKNESTYAGVWWVLSESESAILTRFGELAARLNLPVSENGDLRSAASAAREYLERRNENEQWLLTFDNAADIELVSKWIPHRGSIHAIVTSWLSRWDGDRAFKPIPVGELPPDVAQQFLMQRSGDHDAESAAELARELGYLPLALEQAGAYVHALPQFRSLAKYLKLFRTDPGVALTGHKPKTGNYPDTVFTTWTISLGAAIEEVPAAGDLMTLFSFLAPDAIPLDLILANAEFLPESLRQALEDPELRVVEILDRYSLISLGENGDVSLHRLIQTVTFHRLDDDQKRTWAGHAVRLLGNMFPEKSVEFENWTQSARSLPHSIRVLDLGKRWGNQDVERATLLARAGSFFVSQGELSSARAFDEEALALRRKLLPADHPDLATSMNNLGYVLRAQGDLEVARELYEEALAIRKSTLPAEHPDIAQSLNNLAFVLREQGDLNQARVLYEDALERRKRELPADHPSIALSLNNLALVLRKQGELAEATAMYEAALAMRRRVLAANHPSIATSLNNLAFIQKQRGELAEARTLYEEALAIRREVLPREHPKIAASLKSLAGLMEDLNEMELAQTQYEEALEILETALPAGHPTTAVVRGALERVTLAQESKRDNNDSAQEPCDL